MFKFKTDTFQLFNILLIIALTTFVGCTSDEDIIINEVHVDSHGAKPVAYFTFETDNSEIIRSGSQIKFTNHSISAQSYSWDFNDGTVSNEIHPVHSFAHKGIYKVKLTVFNNYGTDTTSIEIPIECKFDNYLIKNNIPYKLDKVKLLSASYRNKQRNCIELSSNNISFGFDSITGQGNAVKILINGSLFEQNLIPFAGSFACAGFNEQYALNDYINLENASLIIKLNDSIIIDIVDNNFELHFSGQYSTGHLYNYPTIEEIETSVRKSHDIRATHSYEQYNELLYELSKDKYRTLTIWEMYNTYDDSKVVVGLRHDVDCHPFKALEMANMETLYGINASYYILATSGYYGEFYPDSVRRNRALDQLYLQLYNSGSEIGIHNDLLTVMIAKKLDPFKFNWKEIFYYESLGIPIYGNVGHGSVIASRTVHNSQMFSDYAKSETIDYNGEIYPIGSHSMLEYGFLYEANFFPYNQSYSDSGGTWNIEGGFEALMQRIKNSKAGDRIQILAHPVWWGKQ